MGFIPIRWRSTREPAQYCRVRQDKVRQENSKFLVINGEEFEEEEFHEEEEFEEEEEEEEDEQDPYSTYKTIDYR